MSYSQSGEDAWIIQNLINQRREDIVVFEVGAFDPFRYSNSYAVEKFFGGKCFLIEPTLSRAARIASKRPHAHVFAAAASESWGFSEILGDSAVSGDPAVLTAEYILAWDLSQAFLSTVPAFPISSLQNSMQVPYIDFMSIDVQGSELEVLKGLDFDKPVGAICIELEGHSPERDAQCRSLLARRKFECRVILGANEIWVNPAYSRWSLLWKEEKVPQRGDILFPYIEPGMRDETMSTLK